MIEEEFKKLDHDKFSFSDRFVADWKNLPVNEPAFAQNMSINPDDESGVYYLRYESDISEVENGLEDSVQTALESAFEFFFQHYGKDFLPGKLEDYAEMYMNYATPISCIYRFSFRGFSAMEVFLKLPGSFLEKFDDQQIGPPPDADQIAIYDPWEDIPWSNLESSLQDMGEYLENNQHKAVYKGQDVDLRKESKYIREYRKRLQSHLNKNRFDGGRVEVGFNTGSLETLYVSDDEGLLTKGQADVSKRIPLQSRLSLQNALSASKVSNLLRDSTELRTERLKSAYPDMSIENVDSPPGDNQDVQDILNQIDLGGLSIAQSINSIAELCELLNQYGANGLANRIKRTERDILEEKALAETEEVLQAIDEAVDEESVFVGNEILDIKNLDEMRFSLTDDIEDVYDQVLNRISIAQLIELVMECIGVGQLPELFLCLLQFRTLKIPFPPRISVPDIFGFLSDLLRKTLLTLVSRILSTILNRIFQELRNCFKQDDKGIVPKAGEDAPGIVSSNPTEAADVARASDLVGKGIPEEKFANLLDDLSVALTFQEICDLFRGEADAETLEIVERIIDNRYPTISEELDTRSRIEKCFEQIGEDALERLDDFCKQKFGVGVDQASEYLCPQEGIRDEIKRDILSKKNLNPGQIDELLKCERERDKEKEQFFKGMMQSDNPLEDMMFGDKDPQQFLRESQPPAKKDGPKVKVFVDQMEGVVNSVNQSYVSSVQQIVSNQKDAQIKSPFPNGGSISFEENTIEVEGNGGKRIRFEESDEGAIIKEDERIIRQSVVGEEVNLIQDVQSDFVKSVKDSLLSNTTLAPASQTYLKNRVFDEFGDQFFEEIIGRVNSAYSDSGLRDELFTLADEEFLNRATPGNESIKPFAQKSFMDKESGSRNARDESMKAAKELVSLLWLRYKLLTFSIFTFPFDNFNSLETESRFTKSQRVNELIEKKDKFRESLERADYADGKKVFDDYQKILNKNNAIDDSNSSRFIIFGHQKDSTKIVTPADRSGDIKKLTGVSEDEPTSVFLLQKMVVLRVEEDGSSKKIVRGYPPNGDFSVFDETDSSTGEVVGGTDTSEQESSSPFESESPESSGESPFDTTSEKEKVEDSPFTPNKDEGQSGDTRASTTSGEEQGPRLVSAKAALRLTLAIPEKQRSVFRDEQNLNESERAFFVEIDNTPFDIVPFAKAEKDITGDVDFGDELKDSSAPDFSKYSDDLEEKVYDDAADVVPHPPLLSMLRIYAAEKSKEFFNFSEPLENVEDVIEDSFDDIEEIQNGNNLFQYD